MTKKTKPHKILSEISIVPIFVVIAAIISIFITIFVFFPENGPEAIKNYMQNINLFAIFGITCTVAIFTYLQTIKSKKIYINKYKRVLFVSNEIMFLSTLTFTVGSILLPAKSLVSENISYLANCILNISNLIGGLLIIFSITFFLTFTLIIIYKIIEYMTLEIILGLKKI